VSGEGGVGLEADVDGTIIVIILGDQDPLGSSELLFQMMGDDLLFLLSKGEHTRASYRVLRATATMAMRTSCSRCAIAA
jgi:hypothetical protein